MRMIINDKDKDKIKIRVSVKFIRSVLLCFFSKLHKRTLSKTPLKANMQNVTIKWRDRCRVSCLVAWLLRDDEIHPPRHLFAYRDGRTYLFKYWKNPIQYSYTVHLECETVPRAKVYTTTASAYSCFVLSICLAIYHGLLFSIVETRHESAIHCQYHECT